MNFCKTDIPDLYRIELEYKQDERGYLTRTFCKQELSDFGINVDIVQANRTLTKNERTLRGLHYQRKPKEESKIVRCTWGRIFDVVVDLRADSPAYGHWYAAELGENNDTMLLIPKGCAHGFLTLADNCVVEYFMSEYYDPACAEGIHFNDPDLAIDWPSEPRFLSEKDKRLPFLRDNVQQ
jgi:dTDP-4-dehydrorhamnose 3,5-epimerase